MAKTGTGTIRKVGDSIMVRIPYEVRNDSEFPFKVADEVETTIVPDMENRGKKMIILRKA